MRKKGDANDAPTTHIQDAAINMYCVTDAIRLTLSPYFITEFAQVRTSISLKSKIMNAAQDESTCLLFFPFMCVECQKSIIYRHTYWIVNRRDGRRKLTEFTLTT